MAEGEIEEKIAEDGVSWSGQDDSDHFGKRKEDELMMTLTKDEQKRLLKCVQSKPEMLVTLHWTLVIWLLHNDSKICSGHYGNS